MGAFEKHIPHYPGETHVPASTLKTTVFFSEDDKRSNELLETYGYGNSKARDRAVAQIAALPDQAGVLSLRDLARDQLAQRYDQPRLGADFQYYENVEKLLGRVESEFVASENAQIRFRFERHEVKDPGKNETVVAALETEMRSVFKEGEKNFLFIEDANGSEGTGPLVLATISRKMSDGMSFQQAFAHTTLRGISSSNYHAGEVDNYVKNVKTSVSTDVYTRYLFLMGEAVDRLVSDGIQINFLNEEGKAYLLPVSDTNTLQEYIRLHEFLQRTKRPREKRIRKQLEQVVKTAPDGQKTNILALLGYNHKGMELGLPHSFSSITAVSEQHPDEWGFEQAEVEINLLMQQERPIPRKVYEASFQAFLRRSK